MENKVNINTMENKEAIFNARCTLNMSPLELVDDTYNELRLFTVFFRYKDNTYRLVQSDSLISNNECIGSLNEVVETMIKKGKHVDKRIKDIKTIE